MRLTNKQQTVLANSLAYCGYDFEPTEQEIADFFANIDKGRPLPKLEFVTHDATGQPFYRGKAVQPGDWLEENDGARQLKNGWTAYYSDPFRWIKDWKAGKLKNPPEMIPQAWIYDAYFSDGISWCGWATLLEDILRDCLDHKVTWERVRPQYESIYKLHQEICGDFYLKLAGRHGSGNSFQFEGGAGCKALAQNP